ncbi:response regulator [Streptomyces phytohabitans]|uniref:response regulator n=1 Tax=Streptomyces phytohabitans TaxID=1150371 RepID=UPI00345C318F
MNIRVLLADDEETVRAGVRALLAADPGVEVVAEAADGRTAVELARAHRPDVALLALGLPRLDGVAAAEEILRARDGAETAVALLAASAGDARLGRALGCGATGFLLRDGDGARGSGEGGPHELLAGIRAVARGGAFLSPRIARHALAAAGGDERDGGAADGGLSRGARARARTDGLTTRQREVLALVARGLAPADVARRLHLVEDAVRGHMSAVLDRLGAENRVQAALVAYEAGLA